MRNGISQKKFFKVFAKTNGRCFYCNGFAEEVDHFVSRAWAKREDMYDESIEDVENLVPACKSCNAGKKDKEPESFIGNSYKCWKRAFRANRRIGVQSYDSFPDSSVNDDASAYWGWISLLEKYG